MFDFIERCGSWCRVVFVERYRHTKRFFVSLVWGMVFLMIGLVCVDLWKDSGPLPPAEDYLAEFERLREEGNTYEAISLSKAIAAQPDLPNAAMIVERGEELRKSESAWYKRIWRTSWDGFILGKSETTDRLVGATLSDFIFIGDARDITTETVKKIRGDDPDVVLATLATVGVVADVATWIPEPGSSAGGISANLALTILKGLRRAGALSTSFAKQLVMLSRRAVDSRSLDPLMTTLKSITTLRHNAPKGTMTRLTKPVQNVDELNVVSTWTAAAPHETVVLLRKKGRDGVSFLARAGEPSIDKAKAWVRSGGRKVKTPTRFAKYAYRGRIGEWMDVAKRYLRSNGFLRYGILILALLSFAGCIRAGCGVVGGVKGMISPRTRGSAPASGDAGSG